MEFTKHNNILWWVGGYTLAYIYYTPLINMEFTYTKIYLGELALNTKL